MAARVAFAPVLLVHLTTSGLALVARKSVAADKAECERQVNVCASDPDCAKIFEMSMKEGFGTMVDEAKENMKADAVMECMAAFDNVQASTRAKRISRKTLKLEYLMGNTRQVRAKPCGWFESPRKCDKLNNAAKTIELTCAGANGCTEDECLNLCSAQDVAGCCTYRNDLQGVNPSTCNFGANIDVFVNVTNWEFMASLCGDDVVPGPKPTPAPTSVSTGPCENFQGGLEFGGKKCQGFSSTNKLLCGKGAGGSVGSTELPTCTKSECKTKCEAEGVAGCCTYFDELKTANPNACFFSAGKSVQDAQNNELWASTCVASSDPEIGTFSATPDPTPAPTPDPTPAPTPDPTPAPTPDPTPDPTPAPTTTPSCDNSTGTCTVFEDPHINVFDGAQVSLFRLQKAASSLHINVFDGANSGSDDEVGDKWLVKSGDISIQARFLPNDELASQNLFVRAVAVGGPFLKGSTLIIGSLADNITWNGNSILEFNTSIFRVEDPVVEGTRSTHSFLVEDLSQENPGVNLNLPSGVTLIANRLPSHVNIAIKMPTQAGGQDGLCGNFNGVASDDAVEFVSRRTASIVPEEESLFRGSSIPFFKDST